MKTNRFALRSVLALALAIATPMFAADPPTPAPAPAEQPDKEPAPPPPPPQPGQPNPALTSEVQKPAAPDVSQVTRNPDELRLNFRGVSLDTVLDYLSEAAGFIIVKEARVRGTVDVWSGQPVSKDEAVNLLNTVLNKNGYAAIRIDRTLTIVNRDEAKTHDVPVVQGSDPAEIPRTDEIVTQIIPVRSVDVTQLAKDLQPLVSMQTTMTANEAGNSIVITDTRAKIRRVAEIIRAIDKGAEDPTVVRVFHLKFADPVELSELLSNLFPDDTSRQGGGGGQGVQFGPFGRFGGFGGFGRGGGGGQNSSSSASQNQRVRKRNKVISVPDQRTASLIVTATQDLMEQIEGVVTELDENPKGRRVVRVFDLH